jgi:hypothetical protein
MSENEIVEEYELFYYLDNKGRKLFTPSEIYASIRADFFGTKKVYVEKN